MKISGFTFIRNGINYGYPFVESVKTLTKLCDEVIVVVGNSIDNTLQSIEGIGSDKIKIIHSIWDDSLREGGSVFCEQANIGFDNISGDWGIHLQADEVFHESDYENIIKAIKENNNNPKVEGLLFNFLNFYGSYNYIGVTRRWHRKEVRVVRNIPQIRSYRDSQGFRYYNSSKIRCYNNRPLKVIDTDINVFHYSYVRNPSLMQKKSSYFHSFWHDDNWLSKNVKETEYNFIENIDDLKEFNSSHPQIMLDRIKTKDWNFIYDNKLRIKSFKDKILYFIEKKTGWRIGEYKNYKIIGKE